MPPPRFEHNRESRWQGRVRYGWFDAVLARYALEALGGVDALALTHVDGLKRLPTWTACTGYLGAGMPQNAKLIADLAGDGLFTRLVLPVEESIDRQVRLTHLLSRVAPRLEEFESKETSVFEQVQRLLARTVDIVSRGPCATEVFFRRECLAVSAAVPRMRE
jgi:adenylosuccinate synthase